MKLIRSHQVKEFTYTSKTTRNYHVAEMEANGWTESGQVKRMKEDINILTATEADFEWYAHFRKEDL